MSLLIVDSFRAFRGTHHAHHVFATLTLHAAAPGLVKSRRRRRRSGIGVTLETWDIIHIFVEEGEVNRAGFVVGRPHSGGELVLLDHRFDKSF